MYEYDALGNIIRETLALAEEPTVANSPVTEYAYGAESTEEGIFSLSTTTRYNAAGQPLASTQKQLVSQLSSTLESKVISVNERGLTSTQWNVYNTDTKRIRGFSPCFQFITYEKHYLFIVVVIVRYVFC